MNNFKEKQISIPDNSYVSFSEKSSCAKEFCNDLKNLLLPIILGFASLSLIIYIVCLI